MTLSWAGGGLIGKPLPLALPLGSRGRQMMSGRSWDTPLRWRLLLNGLACPRDEMADSQVLLVTMSLGAECVLEESLDSAASCAAT